MANLNESKSVPFPPTVEKRSDDSSIAVMKDIKFYEVVTTSKDRAVQVQHENRLKDLRGELEYLKQTAWQYEPIEKYIGQSPQ